MYNNDVILKKFKDNYAKDLILCQMGQDAVCYAEDFVITDFFYNKYKRVVLDNKKILEGKTVLDVGANMGHWGLLSLLNGAKSVTCVEPRGQYVNGLNKFSKMHGLDITSVQGIHSDIFELGEKFDVVMLGVITECIPDVYGFLQQLKAITKHVIILHTSLRDLPPGLCKMEKSYNLTHRTAVDPRSKGYLNNETGNQFDTKDWSSDDTSKEGVCFRWYYGIDHMTEIFKHFNYKVLRLEEHTQDALAGTVDLPGKFMQHIIVLEAEQL